MAGAVERPVSRPGCQGVAAKSSPIERDHESSMRWIAAILAASTAHGLRSLLHLKRNSHRPVTENMQAAMTSNASHVYLRPAPESLVFCVSTLASPSL